MEWEGVTTAAYEATEDTGTDPLLVLPPDVADDDEHDDAAAVELAVEELTFICEPPAGDDAAGCC